MNRDQVFISYSRKDKDWLEKLQTMLAPLQRKGTLKVWADTDIEPGQKWKEEIEKALARAKVAVLLVSPDFLASDFIDKHELPPLLEAAEKEGLKIIWIPVRASLYKRTIINDYHAAHNPKTPLALLDPAHQEVALAEIAETIESALVYTARPPDTSQSLRPIPELPTSPSVDASPREVSVVTPIQPKPQPKYSIIAFVMGGVLMVGIGVFYLGKQLSVEKPPVSTVESVPQPTPEPRPVPRAQPKQPTDITVSISRVSEPGPVPPMKNIHGWSAQQVQALQQQTAQALKIPVEFRDALKDGSQGPMMVVIPGGRFQMGSLPDEPQRTGGKRPHEVEVAPFAMDKYEVTFEEYDRFATAIQREKPSDSGWGRGRRPVINVTWKDAVAYAEWLSQQTGQTYRLPTEAEWEYAARAGTTTPFYFGTTISTEQANYDGNYTYGGGQKGVYWKKTVEVGQFSANAWGLHDMHGNVWEWSCSEYDEKYGDAALRCISDPNSISPRVMRGGSWIDEPEGLRSAARSRHGPRNRYGNTGFRLARTLTL